MFPTSGIDALIGQLAAVACTERLFNPYHGMDERATICRANLQRYLEQMQALRPPALLVAEAIGYRGARLTGVPLTSERVMLRGVSKFGLFGEGYRPTSGVAAGVAESTASIAWGALIEHADVPPVLWNSVPFHPHPPGRPQANRAPSAEEQRLGLPFLEAVRDLFDAELVLGVGRAAQRALGELGWSFVPLRHPAHGGKAEFVAGLVAALESL